MLPVLVPICGLKEITARCQLKYQEAFRAFAAEGRQRPKPNVDTYSGDVMKFKGILSTFDITACCDGNFAWRSINCPRFLPIGIRCVKIPPVIASSTKRECYCMMDSLHARRKAAISLVFPDYFRYRVVSFILSASAHGKWNPTGC